MNDLFVELDRLIAVAQDQSNKLSRFTLTPAQASTAQQLANTLDQVKAASTRVHDAHATMETQWASSRPELT
jgi:hypothetical protein